MIQSFQFEEIKEIGYHPEFWGQKGHYGVAILSKKKPLDVIKGFAGDMQMIKKDLFKLHLNGKEKKLPS